MIEKDSISALIVEDEKYSRELLIEYLVTRPEIKLGGIAKNGEEAANQLLAKNYDILFLDINLPVKSGIDVLESLDNLPYVIFTTAYDRFAVKAFEIGAIDYLLKPFTLKRFNKAVDKALSIIEDEKAKFNSPHKLGLSFKENGKHYILNYQDIVYLSSNSRKTIIHTEKRCYETPQLLKEFEHKLPDNIFIRIHKQYIVNLIYFSHLQYFIGGQYTLYLNDDDNINLPVGRKFISVLKKKLNI